MRFLYSLPWVVLCTQCTYLHNSPPTNPAHSPEFLPLSLCTPLNYLHYSHPTHIHLSFSHSVISCCNSAFLSLAVAKAVGQTQLSASMTSSLGLSWDQHSANRSTWSHIAFTWDPTLECITSTLEEKGELKEKELNSVGQYWVIKPWWYECEKTLQPHHLKLYCNSRCVLQSQSYSSVTPVLQ